MADLKALASQIAAVAEKIVPLIVPGSPVIKAAVEAGKEAVDLIDKYKATLGMSTPELDRVRAELEPRVLRHIEDTASSLD